MGRPKKELKKIHRKKIKRAVQKAKAFKKGEIPQEKLTRLAKKMLRHPRKKA